MKILKDLKYSKEHEWVKVENGVAIIGITDFAQSQLGDVVFVDMPEEGTKIVSGEEFGAVESVKAVSDIYAPVSGIIKEVNAQLTDAPETVNQDPYGDGWMVKVELADESELENLLDNGGYEKFCNEETD